MRVVFIVIGVLGIILKYLIDRFKILVLNFRENSFIVDSNGI